MRLANIAGIVLLFSACSWAGNIAVGNYSFEDPNLGAGYQYRPSGTGVDWTFTGSAGIAADGSGFELDDPAYGSVPAPDGTQAGFLQYNTNVLSGSLPGTISQLLTGLVSGQMYTVTFEAADRPDIDMPGMLYGGEQNFNVLWDGSVILSIVGATELNANDTFSQFTATFTASAADALSGGTLEFAVNTVGGPMGDRSDFIDGVEVSTLPEPSSLLLVLSGVGLLGFGLRRRLIPSR
jgi:hypothetical protein